MRLRLSPTKENCEHQAKISTKTDKDGCSPAVFRPRSEKKSPVTECFVCCVCLVSVTKSILTMGSCVRFCCYNYNPFAPSVENVPLMVSALKFCCRREIPLATEKLTFDGSIERMSFITRHDDLRRVVIKQFYRASCSFPQSLQRQRLSSSSRSNGKRVSL